MVDRRRRRRQRSGGGRARATVGLPPAAAAAVAFSIVLTDVRFDGICNGWAGGKSCSATPSHGRRNSYNSMELPAWNVGQQWEVVDSGCGGGGADGICMHTGQTGRQAGKAGTLDQTAQRSHERKRL